ncbi:MAG TPA: hypothetical protein PKY81_11610 [bacterium]|nr:hypothetical protein [bacterium]HPN31594.1 hypothetical protein [bacterium]
MKKYLLKILILSFSVVLLTSACNQKKERIEINAGDKKNELKISTGLSEDIIKIFEKTPGIYESVQYIRKLNVPEIKDLTPLEKFETAASREKKIMLFGMLCVDAGYVAIATKKIQIPEYLRLYDKFVSELNLQPVINELKSQYLPEIQKNEFNLDLIEKLIEKWDNDKNEVDKIREERGVFIQKAKDFDEEFAVYYALGAIVEFHSILGKTIVQNDKNQIISKIKNTFNNFDSANFLFIELLCSLEELQYADYAKKLLPVFELYQKQFISDIPLTDQELKSYIKGFEEIRNDILTQK